MVPRFFVDHPLHALDTFALPAGAARHAQVLRLQPGACIALFDGSGGEWDARVTHMGRSEVSVQLGCHNAVDRELSLQVTLALGVPANERMDMVIEKATELGVQAIQPLMCERSVLRLGGERAQKKVAHWRAVALAACEQCGRTRVPQIGPVRAVLDWLGDPQPKGHVRWMLTLSDARDLSATAWPNLGVVCLSGPEGGLTPAEESAARDAGYLGVSLGPRVLRADTAPLALLARLALSATP
jgi:16S rRNA (uracil1498-N3)-methyltransferase